MAQLNNTNDVQRSLGRIEGKLDSVISRLDTMDTIIIDHSAKINLLETFRDNLQGKMSIIGAIGGLIGGVITLVINHFFNK